MICLFITSRAWTPRSLLYMYGVHDSSVKKASFVTNSNSNSNNWICQLRHSMLRSLLHSKQSRRPLYRVRIISVLHGVVLGFVLVEAHIDFVQFYQRKLHDRPPLYHSVGWGAYPVEFMRPFSNMQNSRAFTSVFIRWYSCIVSSFSITLV